MSLCTCYDVNSTISNRNKCIATSHNSHHSALIGCIVRTQETILPPSQVNLPPIMCKTHWKIQKLPDAACCPDCLSSPNEEKCVVCVLPRLALASCPATHVCISS